MTKQSNRGARRESKNLIGKPHDCKEVRYVVTSPSASERLNKKGQKVNPLPCIKYVNSTIRVVRSVMSCMNCMNCFSATKRMNSTSRMNCVTCYGRGSTPVFTTAFRYISICTVLTVGGTYRWRYSPLEVLTVGDTYRWRYLPLKVSGLSV